MKKVLAIVLALALSLALAVPVVAGVNMATNSTTGVEVGQGGGDPPIVKAKWEQLDPAVFADLEDGDPDHNTPLTQLNPSVAFNVSIAPQFWAIVTDPNDVSTVTQVWVNVFHPAGPPECGSKKYKLDLVEQVKGTIGSGGAIDAFIAAWNAGLVTWNCKLFANVTEAYEDILDEIVQCKAKIYMGVGELSYHQPWGDYRVEADAADNNNNYASDWGYNLTNLLTYLPIAGIELDFTHVDYGTVEICHDAWDHGDKIFSLGDGEPTVRNIGNTEVELSIQQDDMGFGYAGTGSNITWNVEFDVRLGEPPCPDIRFDPAGLKGDSDLPRADKWTTITPTLPLCNTQKINFSIHVIQGASANYTGKMWISYQKTAFSGNCTE